MNKIKEAARDGRETTKWFSIRVGPVWMRIYSDWIIKWHPYNHIPASWVLTTKAELAFLSIETLSVRYSIDYSRYMLFCSVSLFKYVFLTIFLFQPKTSHSMCTVEKDRGDKTRLQQYICSAIVDTGTVRRGQNYFRDSDNLRQSTKSGECPWKFWSPY